MRPFRRGSDVDENAHCMLSNGWLLRIADLLHILLVASYLVITTATRDVVRIRVVKVFFVGIDDHSTKIDY